MSVGFEMSEAFHLAIKTGIKDVIKRFILTCGLNLISSNQFIQFMRTELKFKTFSFQNNFAMYTK